MLKRLVRLIKDVDKITLHFNIFVFDFQWSGVREIPYNLKWYKRDFPLILVFKAKKAEGDKIDSSSFFNCLKQGPQVPRSNLTVTKMALTQIVDSKDQFKIKKYDQFSFEVTQ